MQSQTDQSQREQSRTEKMSGGRQLALAILLCVAFALVASFTGSRVAFAQDAPAAPLREVTPDEVNQVAREIWCPLCSGVRLDACELKACEQMKEVIAIKLSEGEDTESIKAYFVEQYGPQVMGEPPRQGFNWLAWILPALAVIVGGFFFWRTTQRMVQPAAPLGASTEVITGGRLPVRPNPAEAKAQKADLLSEEDEYTQKLEEELAKYG